MIEIGKYQELEIRRFVEFGAYLAVPGEREKLLMPARYLTKKMLMAQKSRYLYIRIRKTDLSQQEKNHMLLWGSLRILK